MYRVSVYGHFSSAHFLNNYYGKCENLHGHNYKVQIKLQGTKLQENYIFYDFSDLKKKLNNLLDTLDHQNLNHLEFFKTRNPTSEMIAYYIFQELKKQMPELYLVRVWETENQYAEYSE